MVDPDDFVTGTVSHEFDTIESSTREHGPVSAMPPPDHPQPPGREPGLRGGFRLTIHLPQIPADDAIASVTSYRDSLLRLLEIPQCRGAVFDLSGVQQPPSGLVGLLASAKEHCQGEIELLNPSPAVQEVLRLTKLDNLLVRGATR